MLEIKKCLLVNYFNSNSNEKRFVSNLEHNSAPRIFKKMKKIESILLSLLLTQFSCLGSDYLLLFDDENQNDLLNHSVRIDQSSENQGKSRKFARPHVIQSNQAIQENHKYSLFDLHSSEECKDFLFEECKANEDKDKDKDENENENEK